MHNHYVKLNEETHGVFQNSVCPKEDHHLPVQDSPVLRVLQKAF